MSENQDHSRKTFSKYALVGIASLLVGIGIRDFMIPPSPKRAAIYQEQEKPNLLLIEMVKSHHILVEPTNNRRGIYYPLETHLKNIQNPEEREITRVDILNRAGYYKE
ncbi:MAG TPA: hypothetical protein VJK51_02830 [Candidatus Nanoarchaeia archaeon]|nr:hypothetical protein [Candidatus Nanoarchaeia archaeon]